MRLRLPGAATMPQKNGKKEWGVGIVSPQDASEVHCETDEARIYDDYGNEVLFDEIGGHRSWQIVRRWFREKFGV